MKILNASDLNRIADLYVQLAIDTQCKRDHWVTFSKTGEKVDRKLALRFSERCEAIETELLSFGIDQKAAFDRKLDSIIEGSEARKGQTL